MIEQFMEKSASLRKEAINLNGVKGGITSAKNALSSKFPGVTGKIKRGYNKLNSSDPVFGSHAMDKAVMGAGVIGTSTFAPGGVMWRKEQKEKKRLEQGIKDAYKIK